MAARLYSVKISFEAEDPRQLADVAVSTLSEMSPSLAQALTVEAGENAVTVEFPELEGGHVPPAGTEYIPARPADAPGREAVVHLADLEKEPGALLPIVRALVTLVAARERAGLPPRQRVTIEVEPSAPHGADEFEDL